MYPTENPDLASRRWRDRSYRHHVWDLAEAPSSTAGMSSCTVTGDGFLFPTFTL